MSAVDPWVITPKERLKYQEQFSTLQPINGIVTGAQAKGFLLQSQLPPLVLGQIWALADTDADGRMNVNEFSIACKLINLKLRGFEVPKTLPPTLVTSLVAAGGTPTRTPTAMSPVAQVMGPPPVPPQPVIIQQQQQQAQVAHVPPARPPMPTQPVVATVIPQQQVAPPPIPPQPSMIPAAAAPIIPPQPAIMQQIPATAAVPPMMQAAIPGYAIPGNYVAQQPLVQGMVPTQIPTSAAVPMATVMQPPTAIPGVTVPIQAVAPTSNIAAIPSTVPAPPTPPGTAPQSRSMSFCVIGTDRPSGPQSRSMSISMGAGERAPSIESPQGAEWAIKGPAKLKYTQLFNTTDRTRSGFLTGVQARGILMQSKLPQLTLAQIWALSDMDSDGRLGCDEFVLAMYLCDMALQGEKIPAILPIELIPPSFRNKVGSRTGSVVTSRQGSISSQGAPAAVMPEISADVMAGLGQNTFEDKRKENYDKGQAELDRRRKIIEDAQRKEREERERKEREEAEKRERARLEAELKKQQEIEREQQRQRELEEEREEQRKRELEKKEQARKELEKQRQLEWEKQKLSEMEVQREKEQERLLKLKAQNQSLGIELTSLNDKVKDVTQKICDTRSGVTKAKTFIDGMRTTRDTQMSEMTQLKAKIKEQNQRLIQLSQEKAKLDAKTKVNDVADQEQVQAAFSSKQIIIKQLRDKLDELREHVKAKQTDIETNSEQLTELKNELSELIKACEQLYSEYDVQRIQVLELKHNRKNESLTSAWDTTNSWPVEEPAVTATTAAAVDTSGPAPSGYVKYRAIFEFSARNQDEISFQPGDIVMVPLEQNAEPGWLAGEIDGKTGWFPETYVEKIDSPTSAALPVSETYETYPTDNNLSSTATESAVAADVPATQADTTEAYNGDGEYYVSLFAYQSAEPGDLIFDAGENILVIRKDGDWWTGIINNDRTGMFPSNYVQKIDESTNGYNGTNTVSEQHVEPVATYDASPKDNTSMIHESVDDAQNADLDSEVSQINTQSQNDSSQGEVTRPMSRSRSGSSASQRGARWKGEVAQAIASYEATSAEQLSLTKGQLVMIRKKTDSGWWEGELQAKGRRRQIGWFPATYVKVLQSGRISGRTTPVSVSSKIEYNETIIDKVIALYPYKAINDDELSFEKDDIISVLGKDEPEWWRGELNGIVGLFPSNYVGSFASGKKTTNNGGTKTPISTTTPTTAIVVTEKN